MSAEVGFYTCLVIVGYAIIVWFVIRQRNKEQKRTDCIISLTIINQEMDWLVDEAIANELPEEDIHKLRSQQERLRKELEEAVNS